MFGLLFSSQNSIEDAALWRIPIDFSLRVLYFYSLKLWLFFVIAARFYYGHKFSVMQRANWWNFWQFARVMSMENFLLTIILKVK